MEELSKILPTEEEIKEEGRRLSQEHYNCFGAGHSAHPSEADFFAGGKWVLDQIRQRNNK